MQGGGGTCQRAFHRSLVDKGQGIAPLCALKYVVHGGGVAVVTYLFDIHGSPAVAHAPAQLASAIVSLAQTAAYGAVVRVIYHHLGTVCKFYLFHALLLNRAEIFLMSVSQ